MSRFLARKKKSLWYRIASLCFSFLFLFNFTIFPTSVQAQIVNDTTFNLPLPGSMITTTEAFQPAVMTGIVLNPEDPLEFEFMINNGESNLEGEAFQKEAEKLIKYFLATLTIPEEKLWVNLSPYEKEQMISQAFGETEMGRDLLGQDYILKQLSASMMYPKDELGKAFWERVYDKAFELYGTRDIPVNTFNKVWIVPEKADIYENEMGAFIIDSHLKVLLEEDYIALQKNMDKESLGMRDMVKGEAEKISQVTTEVIRELMIPEIEKEVNEGRTFANLRQIYNSMILGSWYKKTLKESLLGQVYVDQNKIAGVDLEDKTAKEKIFNQYIAAFEKGVYNYLKRDYDPQTNEITIQRYFSGGAVFETLPQVIAASPVQSFKAPDTANLIRQMTMSTSPVAKETARSMFRELSPSMQTQVSQELAKSSPVTENTRVVKARFSAASPESFSSYIKSQLNLSDQSASSNPIEIARVNATALSAMSSPAIEQASIQPLRAGIVEVNNEIDAINITNLAATQSFSTPVISIANTGMMERLSVDNLSGQLIRQPISPTAFREMRQSNPVMPIILTEGPSAVTNLEPNVVVDLMAASAFSNQIRSSIPSGSVQIVQSPTNINAIAKAAFAQSSPVVQVNEQGKVSRLSLSSITGQIESEPMEFSELTTMLQSSQVRPIVLAKNSTAIQNLYRSSPVVAQQLALSSIESAEIPTMVRPGSVQFATTPTKVDSMARVAFQQSSPVVQINEGGKLSQLSFNPASNRVETQSMEPAELTRMLQSSPVRPVMLAQSPKAMQDLYQSSPVVAQQLALSSIESAEIPTMVRPGSVQFATTPAKVDSMARMALQQNSPVVKVNEGGEMNRMNISAITGLVQSQKIEPAEFKAMLSSPVKPVVLAQSPKAMQDLYQSSPVVAQQLALSSIESAEIPTMVRPGSVQFAATPAKVDSMARMAFQQSSPVFKLSNGGEIDRLTISPITGQIEFQTNDVNDFGRMLSSSSVRPIVLAESATAVQDLYRSSPVVAQQLAIAAIENAEIPTMVRAGSVQVVQTPREVNTLARVAFQQNSPVVQVTEGGEVSRLNLNPETRQIERQKMEPAAFTQMLQSSPVKPVILASSQAIQDLYQSSPVAAQKLAEISLSSSRVESSRLAETTRVANFTNNVRRVVSDGPGSINIPEAQRVALNGRSPVFTLASQRVIDLDQGKIDLSGAQRGGIVQRLDTEIGGMISDFEKPSATFNQKVDLFYQIQAATTTRDRLEGKSVMAPRFGLSTDEVRAFKSGQMNNTIELRDTMKALNHQLSGLMNVEKALRTSDNPADKSYHQAIQMSKQNVLTSIDAVSSAVQRANTAERVFQKVNNPQDRRQLFEQSQSYTKVPDFVRQIGNAKGPIFAVQPSGAVDRLEPSRAVALLPKTQAIHVSNDNFTFLEVSETPRDLSQQDRNLIRSFEPVKINKPNVVNLVKRLDNNTRPEELGGIDMNPSFLDMQIKRDGQGVPLPVMQQPMDTMNIQGFIPVIMDISPATHTMPFVLGQIDGLDDQSGGMEKPKAEAEVSFAVSNARF